MQVWPSVRREKVVSNAKAGHEPRLKSPSNARHTLVRIEAARHGLVAAWCPMDPRPRTPCDQGSRPAAVAINLINRQLALEATAVK